jgi:hypothetical protein
MNRYTFWIGVCAATALITAAGEETVPKEQSLRLELDLVDGSRLVGTPGLATVPVQTSYAKMDVPLTQIKALKIGDDHESVTLNLRNGDTLTGVISLAPIKLITVFGTASIGIEHIRQFTIVRTGSALPETLRKGLVLYYSFDQNDGFKVIEDSGKGHDGTVKGATWIPKGKIGGAYSFNGRNARISLGQPMPDSTTGTVSLWMRSTSTEQGAFLAKGVSDAGDGPYLIFTLWSGHMAFWYWNCTALSSTTIINDGKWRHLVWTQDGTNLVMYADGIRQTYSISPGGYWFSSFVGNTWNLGVLDRSTDFGYYDGDLDEMMIYNRALSEDEVKLLYDAGK